MTSLYKDYVVKLEHLRYDLIDSNHICGQENGVLEAPFGSFFRSVWKVSQILTIRRFPFLL